MHNDAHADATADAHAARQLSKRPTQAGKVTDKQDTPQRKPQLGSYASDKQATNPKPTQEDPTLPLTPTYASPRHEENLIP